MNTFQDLISNLGSQILARTQEHLSLTLTAMAIAVLIALPAGIYLARCRLRIVVTAIMGLANIIQPIPSLATVAMTVVVFYYINTAIGTTLPTIGRLPGLVALVAYALLPILRNTYTGIRQVDSAVIEVATGMGMTKTQILFNVELPLALPVIMAGIRISTVWTVGVATLVSLVGAGGLGDMIFKGLSNYRMDLILAGAVPAAILALILDWLLGLLEKWLTPASGEP